MLVHLSLRKHEYGSHFPLWLNTHSVTPNVPKNHNELLVYVLVLVQHWHTVIGFQFRCSFVTCSDADTQTSNCDFGTFVSANALTSF